MPSSEPTTTITVHASTLRALQEFKKGGETWDAFLLDTVPKGRPLRFYMNDADREELDLGKLTPRMAAELRRRKREPRMSAEELYDALGLPAP
ncbi:MAG: hypothetical protein ACREB9_03055 [Thermoplasmata archaeon]